MTLTIPIITAGIKGVLEVGAEMNRGPQDGIAEDVIVDVIVTQAAVIAFAGRGRDAGSTVGRDAIAATVSTEKPSPAAPVEIWIAAAVIALVVTAVVAIAEVSIVTGVAVRPWIAVMPAAASQ
jgi:hypothetical protein